MTATEMQRAQQDKFNKDLRQQISDNIYLSHPDGWKPSSDINVSIRFEGIRLTTIPDVWDIDTMHPVTVIAELLESCLWDALGKFDPEWKKRVVTVNIHRLDWLVMEIIAAHHISQDFHPMIRHKLATAIYYKINIDYDHTFELTPERTGENPRYFIEPTLILRPNRDATLMKHMTDTKFRYILTVLMPAVDFRCRPLAKNEIPIELIYDALDRVIGIVKSTLDSELYDFLKTANVGGYSKIFVDYVSIKTIADQLVVNDGWQTRKASSITDAVKQYLMKPENRVTDNGIRFYVYFN